MTDDLKRPWLVLTTVTVDEKDLLRIATWDHGNKEEIFSTYKEKLGEGKHFLVPVREYMEITNVAEEDKPLILEA